jgi:hypothetical protein
LGGAPNDSLALTNFTDLLFNSGFSPHLTTTGTYNVHAHVQLGSVVDHSKCHGHDRSNSGCVTLTLQPTRVTGSDSPADLVTFNWTSNLTTCSGNSQADVGRGDLR